MVTSECSLNTTNYLRAVLPLVLGLYEAFATVIQIDDGEDVHSRAFLSSISVNAMIGDSSGGNNNNSTKKDGE